MTDEEEQKTVMVAVDDSPASERACQWAVDHVLRPGDKLHLIHVLESPSAYMVGPEDTAFVTSDLENDGRDATAMLFMSDKFVPRLQGVPFKVEVAHCEGSAGKTVCRRAQDVHAEAVVMASHNKGAMQRLFLGSTSDYCAKHCPQPLVIVR